MICKRKSCKHCKRHYKQWKKLERKLLMHDFLNHWGVIGGRTLTNSRWWEEFCFEWCEYFGYDDEEYKKEFDKDIIKQFPFYLSKNKSKLFFDKHWSEFSKCYSDYFYWVK
jgi:hypothetical protein